MKKLLQIIKDAANGLSLLYVIQHQQTLNCR